MKTQKELKELAKLERRDIVNNSIYANIGYSKSLHFDLLSFELQNYYMTILKGMDDE